MLNYTAGLNYTSKGALKLIWQIKNNPYLSERLPLRHTQVYTND